MKEKDVFQNVKDQLLESSERINHIMAPALESINNFSLNWEPIIQQMREEWERMREECSIEYEGVQSQFNAYFNKEGMISPKDVDEFIEWLINKNPDIQMRELIYEAKRPYNYNLFHEYKVKCLKEDWNLAKEIRYWEKNNDDTLKAKKETLSDLITHSKGIEIVEGIKTQFKNIQGKRLKLLLMALQELNLLPKERIALKFHKLCKSEFDWDIASYQAMNDYQYNDYQDQTELDHMKQYLENLISPK
jgi:predicted phage tail protein